MAFPIGECTSCHQPRNLVRKEGDEALCVRCDAERDPNGLSRRWLGSGINRLVVEAVADDVLRARRTADLTSA